MSIDQAREHDVVIGSDDLIKWAHFGEVFMATDRDNRGLLDHHGTMFNDRSMPIEGEDRITEHEKSHRSLLRRGRSFPSAPQPGNGSLAGGTAAVDW